MVQNAVDKSSKEMEICWVGLDPPNSDHTSNLDASLQQTHNSGQSPLTVEKLIQFLEINSNRQPAFARNPERRPGDRDARAVFSRSCLSFGPILAAARAEELGQGCQRF